MSINEGGITMKKALTIILAVCLTCAFTASAEANYTTTLDIFGGLMFNPAEGGLVFPDDSTPNVGSETWDMTNPAILSQINGEAPYSGVLALSYDIDYNIPDWNQEYEWVLGVDLWIEGTTYQFGDPSNLIDVVEVRRPSEDDFSASLTDTFGLGSFALADSGYTKAQVLGFLSGIPMDGYDSDIGGYLIDGNLQAGTIYAALEEDVRIPRELIIAAEREFGGINWDAVEAEFGGRVTLTALSDEEQVIPEPGTLALLGSGLIGLLGYRKKRS